MDPFHVVAPAGDALDRCRQRVQQDTCGHRGRVGDPLYGIRRVLRTGVSLLTDRQHARLASVFTADEHAAVEATWGTYQRIVSAYRQPDRRAGKTDLTAVIKTISHGVPAGLPELSRLGRTLKQRAADVLAYFDRPGTSNGPTEAINGRLEHLRGTALGFRNLTNLDTSKISRWPLIYAGLIPTPEQTPGSGRTRTPLPRTRPAVRQWRWTFDDPWDHRFG